MLSPSHAASGFSIGRRAPERIRSPLASSPLGDQLVVVLGLAGARLRAPALERRLGAALRAAGLALAALEAGALRVAPVLRGAARLATGLDEAVEDEESSSAHLPDRTRCAASATASAISVPSLEALVIIAVAAWLALSAASSPASRIALRALGLAAIAA